MRQSPYGSRILLGGFLANKAIEDYNKYQTLSNYSGDYASYATEGSYLPALTGNLMLGSMNSGLFANPIDQMRFDGIIPEIDIKAPMNNIGISSATRTMPIMQTEASSLLREIRMDIDPNAGKPIIESFPIVRPKSILLETEDESTKIAKIFTLPGFMPVIPKLEDFILRTPIHQTNWHDLILYKDINNTGKFAEFEHFKKTDGSERYECEKSQSPQWQEAKPYKGYGGKYRYNGLNGKDREYYRWDHRHKDIEVYDDNRKKLGSKDPVTGKIYRDK